MSELKDFVLRFYQVNGALVEPPRYGAHEVLLPDDLAGKLDVQALQEVVFDEEGPTVDDGRLHLVQGHPLIDRMVEEARQAPAPAQTHINSVRLDKHGLADVARQTLSIANARLVEMPNQVETPVLSHYLVFTFKVTLATDEKQELLASVTMDAQGGWPVDWDAIQAQAVPDGQPTFGDLTPGRPRWIDEPHPLTPASLAGLFQRAQGAVLARIAGPIQSLSRRAARFLELDRARLEQYYDDMERDLERRRHRAEGERRSALQDKIASVQAERRLKLADAEARYQLRVGLELITAQVVTQPKLILQVQIENRNAAIQRYVVWDPLLRSLEPLPCDACGQPGRSLQLCSGGHLAHAECLLEQQCADCKRVYCRLCREQMMSCAVCSRPICQASLNRCGICGRGTCREHTGLCHAADGSVKTISRADERRTGPATPSKKAKATAAAVGAASAAARSSKPQKPARARPGASQPPRARSDSLPRPAARTNTANYRLIVEVEWGEPTVTAFVLTSKKRGPAVRTWRLSPQGICVACDCEKGPDCPRDGTLLRPAGVRDVEAQMQGQIESLRQEYGVPARGVRYTLYMHGMPSDEPRLVLRGQWKDEELLARAREGFDDVYARQHPGSAPPAVRQAPVEHSPRPLGTEEAAEAKRLLRAAYGLLRLEGTLIEEDLYRRVWDLVQPGEWCTQELVGALVRDNTGFFKVLANGQVATREVSNVQVLAARKRADRLPPRQWTVEELLAVADGTVPLSEREERIEGELHTLTGPQVSVLAIQRSLRQGVLPATVVSHMEGHYALTDRSALRRVAALVEELSEHTRRWELGGRTPAEAKESQPAPHTR